MAALPVTPVLAQQDIPGTGPNPMNMLQPAGPVAGNIGLLLWGLIALSVAVVVIITLLVVIAVLRGRRHPADGELPPVERPRGGVAWIYVGVGVSTVALVLFTGWTVVTMAAIEAPPGARALTVDVTARQWWWQLDYTDADGNRFTTANEIHLPVGVPVHFRISSADVIHSFWVPALGGKTDAIPGRTNDTWLQADKPGTYRGQCAEYCGLEHALMALTLVADPPADYARWQQRQMAEAATPAADAVATGEQVFAARCASCHTVRGTDAAGTLGPDLTHVMSRTTLAAGTLPNTIANLSGWIGNPQEIKPGARMPNVPLSGPELQAVLRYVETLQ